MKTANGRNGHNGTKNNHANGSSPSVIGRMCSCGADDDEIVASKPAGRAIDLAGLSQNVESILHQIGEDPQREGLLKTPMRVAKALDFLTSGYTMSVEELVNGAVFHEQYDEIVSIKNIHFFSMCEHHMLPFYGIANVAYIPDGKVIGLSKIPRIVDVFSRRLQVQERLTNQIAQCLQEVLQPRGVAVVMEGYHLCMMMRGVQKQDCTTVTSAMLGDFRTNQNTRQEFLTLCGSHTIHR